jgi:V/A-type H+-transporting ATPase subunit C
MGAVARYAYLHSRVSAMSVRLLSADRLRSLVELAPGQEGDIFQISALAGLHPEEPSEPPSSLEQRLITLLMADFVIFVRALSGPAREFLLYWADRFELSNLKAILRGKMTGQSVTAIRDQLVDMGPFARLPVEDLLRADDVAEMLRRLERTPFADIAREARRIYDEHRDLFSLDAAVDRRYFAGLWKRAAKAERGRERPLRSLVGGIIDRFNLVWLLRYRFAYHLSPAEAYYLLIPAGHRLDGRKLLALSQLGSFAEVIERLPPPFAAWLADARTASDVASVLDREGWRQAQAVLRHGMFNLARVFAYLVLRDKDLRQLRAVIKGKRLRMHIALIREAVDLPAEG